MRIPEALRHLATVGDHDDHSTARRAQEQARNQPKPMSAAEIEQILSSTDA